MIQVEKSTPVWKGRKLVKPPHRYQLELARIKSDYSIFDRMNGKNDTKRENDFKKFCGFFPDIVNSASSMRIPLDIEGYTSINGESSTLILAKGSLGKLRHFSSMHEKLLNEYHVLLNYTNRHLFIRVSPSLSPDHVLMRCYCPHTIRCERIIEKRDMLYGLMQHPWAEWDHGFCFYSKEDMMLAAMTIL